MKFRFHFLLFLFPFSLFSQSASKQFKKLSRPEKRWVIFHPLVAKNAFEITRRVQADVDSIRRTGIIGADLNGGKLDAFKHAYWMLSLTDEIHKRRALKLGRAHERGNYLQFKKHQLEDAVLPDRASSEMDLKNNRAGADAHGYCLMYNDPPVLQAMILTALEQGALTIIKKDAQGNYLDCDGNPIDMNAWKGKWNIPKCLIASDK